MFRLGSITSHTRHTLAAGVWGLMACALMSAQLTAAAPASAVAHSSAAASAPAASTVALNSVGAGLRSAEVPLATTSARGKGEPVTRVLRTDGFSMVGFAWTGERRLKARIRVRRDGQWRAWRPVAWTGDGPDADSPEATGRRGTDLLWTGAADQIEIETSGREPDGLAVVFMDPEGVRGQESAPMRTAQRPRRPDRAPRPKIRSRASWGAVEKWRTSRPVHDKVVRQVHVHHTAGSNRYSRDQVPGILASIYRYHTKVLGWSDIGYNVLVDRFGRAWVGRRGGVGKRVRGAHTLGFNHKSTGIAVIGNFETRAPKDRVTSKVAKIAAWQFDRHRSRARGKVTRTSRGSDLYPRRTKVRLPRIDAHSHTNATACPGEALRDALPEIRRLAQKGIRRFS